MKTLGIWLGFDYQTPLKREGIGRFSVYLIMHLLKNYPLEVEVWCYSFNVPEVRELFGDLLNDAKYYERITIKTEKDFILTAEDRWSVIKQAIKPVYWILIYGRGISWKEPYRIYRSHYGIMWKRRKDKPGDLTDILKYVLYLPFDIITSMFLILSGFTIRLIRKLFLRDVILKDIAVNKKYIAMRGADLPSNTGVIEGDNRVGRTGDKNDYLVYGPYLKLSKGLYEISIEYHTDGLNSGVIGYWDISFDRGKRIFRSGTIQNTGRGVIQERILIYGDYEYMPMEIRVKYNGTGRLAVNKIEIFHSDIEKEDPKTKDLLATLANNYSKTDCFLIPIITLFNALELSKPKLITVHDLVHFEFYESFLKEGTTNDAWITECKRNIYKFADQNCFFCSNSDYVRRNHVLKYINNIEEKNTSFVYLPVNSPAKIQERVLKRDGILIKYNMKNDYIFYPSQIRPYKNIITLLKALKILVDRGVNLQLVLTGHPEHMLSVNAYINENALTSYVVFAMDVPEIDLYSLHKHAIATVVPTLFEGGFPWQGLEAMLMDTPAIMSRIPVTIERLKFNGFDPENCGLKLFDPENAEELASRVLEVMKDREKAVLEQSDVKEKLFSYTWDDVSRQYYKLFTELLSRNENRNEHKFPYSARQENYQNK